MAASGKRMVDQWANFSKDQKSGAHRSQRKLDGIVSYDMDDPSQASSLPVEELTPNAQSAADKIRQDALDRFGAPPKEKEVLRGAGHSMFNWDSGKDKDTNKDNDQPVKPPDNSKNHTEPGPRNNLAVPSAGSSGDKNALLGTPRAVPAELDPLENYTQGVTKEDIERAKANIDESGAKAPSWLSRAVAQRGGDEKTGGKDKAPEKKPKEKKDKDSKTRSAVKQSSSGGSVRKSSGNPGKIAPTKSESSVSPVKAGAGQLRKDLEALMARVAALESENKDLKKRVALLEKK